MGRERDSERMVTREGGREMGRVCLSIAVVKAAA